jgi:thiamine pyrophosphokinase
MHTVIFAGGTVKSGRAVYEAIAAAALIIAADSGAATALRFGCTPSILVGDFDSLDAYTLHQLEERGIEIQRVPVEKDETDTALAIQVALERGATSITLLGALGGTRFDHAAANMLLLLAVEAVPFAIVDGPSICWLLRGPGSATVKGHKGDLLSLLPITGDATGVHTSNLYYALQDDTLRLGKTRGTSNVLTQEKAEVSLEKGILLLIHTNAQELG